MTALATHLKVQTSPLAKSENIVYWKTYRVTVLGDRLFRLERSEKKKFRDRATQSVWFRDIEKQDFTFSQSEEQAVVQTSACTLILKEKGDKKE